MAKGKHLIADIENFPKVDIEFCLEKMLEAVPLMGARIVSSNYSRNPDQACVILDESHIALHIFENQQKKSAFLDVFTCGSSDPVKGYEYLKEQIGFSGGKYKVYSRFI